MVKTNTHYNMVRKKPLQLSHSEGKLSKVLPGSVVGSCSWEIYLVLLDEKGRKIESEGVSEGEK